MIRLPGDQNFWPARPLPSPMLPRAAQGYGQEEMLPQPRELGHRRWRIAVTSMVR